MAKRNYDNDYISVTGVLNVLRKPGLENWFKYNTLAFINEESEKAKTIGNSIHEAIQSHIETNEVKLETQYADEVMNALRGFMLFKKEHPEIKLKRSEMMLTSLQHKYNGTMDVEGEINSIIVPGDWKSGNAKDKDRPEIYDEFIVQVAAYLKAYNEVTGQETKEAFIAVFAKDKVAYNYRLIPAEEIDLCFNEIFLPAVRIYYGQKELTQTRKEQGNAAR